MAIGAARVEVATNVTGMVAAGRVAVAASAIEVEQPASAINKKMKGNDFILINGD